MLVIRNANKMEIKILYWSELILYIQSIRLHCYGFQIGCGNLKFIVIVLVLLLSKLICDIIFSLFNFGIVIKIPFIFAENGNLHGFFKPPAKMLETHVEGFVEM